MKKKGPGGINCKVATATDKLKEPAAHPHAEQVANENVDSFNNQACPVDDDDDAVEVGDLIRLNLITGSDHNCQQIVP